MANLSVVILNDVDRMGTFVSSFWNVLCVQKKSGCWYIELIILFENMKVCLFSESHNFNRFLRRKRRVKEKGTPMKNGNAPQWKSIRIFNQFAWNGFQMFVSTWVTSCREIGATLRFIKSDCFSPKHDCNANVWRHLNEALSISKQSLTTIAFHLMLEK